MLVQNNNPLAVDVGGVVIQPGKTAEVDDGLYVNDLKQGGVAVISGGKPAKKASKSPAAVDAPPIQDQPAPVDMDAGQATEPEMEPADELGLDLGDLERR